MNRIIALYADGGVITKNPSEIGGTFAWCHVDLSGERVGTGVGIITPLEARLPVVTNNLTEMLALVEGLEQLPEGWSGTVYSDSLITLGRAFQGWSQTGIPPWLSLRLKQALGRIAASAWVLLDGHPTKAELKLGRGKRGHPVSIHNVWCDEQCKEAAKQFLVEGVIHA